MIEWLLIPFPFSSSALYFLGQPADHEVNLIGGAGHFLMDEPAEVAKHSDRWVLRDNSQAYFVTDKDEGALGFLTGLNQVVSLLQNFFLAPPRHQGIGKPEGQTIEEDEAKKRALFLKGVRDPQGLFEGSPGPGTTFPVAADAFGHFFVEGLGRGQVGPWTGKFSGQLEGELTFPAPGPAGNEDDLFILIHKKMFTAELAENAEIS